MTRDPARGPARAVVAQEAEDAAPEPDSVGLVDAAGGEGEEEDGEGDGRTHFDAVLLIGSGARNGMGRKEERRKCVSQGGKV